MALFNWDASLETGIETIDKQHKRLVSFVNELHDAMLQKKAKEVVGQILLELKNYTVYHFSTEEKAFDRYGFEHSVSHKKSHADLIKQVEELIAKHEKGEFAISVKILEFLISWVKNHIMKEDMLYVPSLKGKEIV